MSEAPPTALLDASPEEGSRRLALRWIAEAEQAADRMLAGGHDDEALHDLRVALRKLRTVLRTYKRPLRGAVPRKRRERLRELVAATGVARDAEVQLAWVLSVGRGLDERERPGARWLRDRLEDLRDGAYLRLRSATVPALLDLLPKLRRDLETYEVRHRVNEPVVIERFGPYTADLVLEQAHELARSLRGLVSVEQDELAHEARIHGKRLRYLVEPLREDVDRAPPVITALKILQDLLGEAHDVAVRGEALRDEIERAALERARRLALEAAQEPASSERDEIDEQPGLLALVRITHQRRQELFDEIVREWSAPGSRLDALLREVHALSDALRERGDAAAEPGPQERASADASAPPREIERKYLLRALPDRAQAITPIEIDQGYLPGERLHERLRRTRRGGEERWYRCVKLGEGIARIEVEEETSREIYGKLWPLTKGRRVRKRRYEIRDGAHVFQIDEFVDRELFLCEVELSSEHEAVALPDWLAPLVVREVTGEPGYVNLNLAR